MRVSVAVNGAALRLVGASGVSNKLCRQIAAGFWRSGNGCSVPPSWDCDWKQPRDLLFLHVLAKRPERDGGRLRHARMLRDALCMLSADQFSFWGQQPRANMLAEAALVGTIEGWCLGCYGSYRRLELIGGCNCGLLKDSIISSAGAGEPFPSSLVQLVPSSSADPVRMRRMMVRKTDRVIC